MDFFGGFPGMVWSVAGGAVIALCGFIYRKGRGFIREHNALVAHLGESDGIKADVEELKAQQPPQNAVLRELMGSDLDTEHRRLVSQGYASPNEKLAYEKKYNAYHGLGGNGTRTALYEDVLQMNAYPKEA